MDRFLVRYTALSTLQVPMSINFNIGHMQVIVNNDSEYNHQSTPWVNRLAVVVIVSAETKDNAIDIARYPAEAIIGLLVTSTSVSIDLCKFDRAIEYNDGIHDRALEQKISVSAIPAISARTFVPETYTEFDAAIKNGENLIFVKHKHRFSRAARWYRKGILEHELFDQFQNFWTALEALKIALNSKYGVPNGYQTEHPCEHCGQSRMVPTEAGILKLIERMGYPPQLWSKLRKVRNKISHGFEPLDKISGDAQELTPILQKMVLFGLIEILNIPDNEKPRFLREPNYFIGNPVIRVQALLRSISLEEISDVSIPRFECLGVQYEQISENEIKAKGSIKLEFPLNNRGFNVINVEIEVPQDPEKPFKLISEITVIYSERSTSIDS